jgi:hypothetical protein
MSLYDEARVRIVARLISNIPSLVQQEMEFIRPLVEERFAKMEEFGEDWDDKPVRLSTSLNVNVIVMRSYRTTCSCGS